MSGAGGLDGRSRRGAERRESSIERLMDAAERLMALDGGFEAVSVARLTREAGLSRSHFYRLVPDKAALLVAVLRRADGAIEDAPGAWWALEGPVSRADLDGALRSMWDRLQPHLPLFAALEDVGAYDEVVRGELGAVARRAADGLRGHIERGQAGGWVDGGLRPGPTAAWLTCLVEETTRVPAEGWPGRFAGAIADIAWWTLYAPARA